MKNSGNDQVKNHFGGRIRVRVCGVLVEQGSILLAEHVGIGEKEKLLIPPGGGLHFGEDIHACLKREFLEETGLDIEVKEMLFVNEFIDHPLHAIELFFRVERISGTLQVGIDPELPRSEQLLQNVSFYTYEDLMSIDPKVLHGVLRYEPNPIKFEHLTGFFNFVVNS